MRLPHLLIATLFFLPLHASADVTCEGRYGWHLQSIARDSAGNLYWSFTVDLVKTDAHGQVLAHVSVPSHHGDLTVANGLVYSAVKLADKDLTEGKGNCWVYAYRAEDLRLAWRKPVRGVGGIGTRDGHLFIAHDKSDSGEAIYLNEYDGDANFLKRHAIDSGPIFLGVQTVCFADGAWWLGLYGKPPQMLHVSDDFSAVTRSEFDCAVGITPGLEGALLVARSLPVFDKRHSARVVTARPDDTGSLTVVTDSLQEDPAEAIR
jgi:hypothetical protein